MRKMLAAAVVLAGIGGFAAVGSAATYTAFGSAGDPGVTVTLTNAVVVSPYDPAGGYECDATSAQFSCNPVNDGVGGAHWDGIGKYDPTGLINPNGGSSPSAEIWYLEQLINGTVTGGGAHLGDAGGGKSGVIDTWYAGMAWTYLLLKYDGEWVWLEILDRFVSFSGLPNGVSHYALYNPVPIPLPAAAWMLLAGLAVLFGVGGARKRRTVSAG